MALEKTMTFGEKKRGLS